MTPGGPIQLRRYTEKQFSIACLRALSEVSKRLIEIYPAGLSLKEHTDFKVIFKIEYTVWDVFEKLIVPALSKSGLEVVIEPRTCDCSYAGEMWVTVKFPEAVRHVMHTVYVGASHSDPRKKISVEQLVDSLDAMLGVVLEAF